MFPRKLTPGQGSLAPSLSTSVKDEAWAMIHEAQKDMAGRIRPQRSTLDVVDDKGRVNNFTIWLQELCKKTATDANLEGQRIGPPHWGAPRW